MPFQKAVDSFDVKKFMGQVQHAGADYLLFTACHALQMLPAPHPVIEKILPGRTCNRDLIAELADALAAKGKHFLVYYTCGFHIHSLAKITSSSRMTAVICSW